MSPMLDLIKTELENEVKKTEKRKITGSKFPITVNRVVILCETLHAPLNNERLDI